MCFSMPVSDAPVAVQLALQLIPVMPAVSAVIVGPPPRSVTRIETAVPSQILIRLAFGPSAVGSTMFPVIACETFALLTLALANPKMS